MCVMPINRLIAHSGHQHDQLPKLAQADSLAMLGNQSSWLVEIQPLDSFYRHLDFNVGWQQVTLLLRLLI